MDEGDPYSGLFYVMLILGIIGVLGFFIVCYGRRVEGKPHLWWLRRTTTTVYAVTDQVAPPWARQQAEEKLAAWQWEIGGVIQITQP